MAGEIDIFNIPAIWYPGQNSEEWEDEISLMMERAIMQQKFLMGEIPASEFLDCIDSQGYDAKNLALGWLEDNNV